MCAKVLSNTFEFYCRFLIGIFIVESFQMKFLASSSNWKPNNFVGNITLRTLKDANDGSASSKFENNALNTAWYNVLYSTPASPSESFNPEEGVSTVVLNLLTPLKTKKVNRNVSSMVYLHTIPPEYSSTPLTIPEKIVQASLDVADSQKTDPFLNHNLTIFYPAVKLNSDDESESNRIENWVKFASGLVRPSATSLNNGHLPSLTSSSEEQSDEKLSSIMSFIDEVSSSDMINAPGTIFNDTKQGVMNFSSTFSTFTFATKIIFLFIISVSVLSIALGVYSLGPPIIAVGAFGVAIPIALIILMGKSNSVRFSTFDDMKKNFWKSSNKSYNLRVILNALEKFGEKSLK